MIHATIELSILTVIQTLKINKVLEMVAFRIIQHDRGERSKECLPCLKLLGERQFSWCPSTATDGAADRLANFMQISCFMIASSKNLVP